MPFTSPSYLGASQLDPTWLGDGSLELAVRNASLIIGLHADGATEAIVDAALLHQTPFVVVPCCVFPNLFCERFLTVIDGGRNDDRDMCRTQVREEGMTVKEKRVPVRTHDQFCKFLMAKDPRFVMDMLPFEGRNIAIWWDGN